jgi:glycosyltransferase involved in cell wall biosynthesis
MTRKLKILYHHRVAAQDGQSVHIKELTAAFADLGHELIFVGPSLRPKEFGSENKLLAFVRRILPRFAQELLELLYGYRAYAKLMRAYKDHKPDILYERHNLFLPAGRLLKKRTGTPYLLEVNAPLAEERAKHSGISLQALGARTETDCWLAADMNFPVSDILADYLRKAGVKESHIQVLHNGINHKDYEEVDGKEIRSKYNLDGKTVLGFTGFLRDWHRLDNIIQMIAKYEEDKSPHLLVVGDGPAVPECKALAAELGIENKVHFAGFQPREAIPHFLAAMDIALQPAVTAYASPLKVFEYMRAGLAIAAPDQPNIREILKDGSTALLFDPENPDARENAIKKLIEDTALRQNLGKAACAEIDRGQYTWRANAERITAIAAELLERNA